MRSSRSRRPKGACRNKDTAPIPPSPRSKDYRAAIQSATIREESQNQALWLLLAFRRRWPVARTMRQQIQARVQFVSFCLGETILPKRRMMWGSLASCRPIGNRPPRSCATGQRRVPTTAQDVTARAVPRDDALALNQHLSLQDRHRGRRDWTSPGTGP